VRSETATPRRVSAALLDDCDKGTWNLSIYCNSSGRPSITHVTLRDPTLDAGRAPARSGMACPKNVQRQYLTCPSELVLPLSWSNVVINCGTEYLSKRSASSEPQRDSKVARVFFSVECRRGEPAPYQDTSRQRLEPSLMSRRGGWPVRSC
jgi:hypothetical protein